VTGKGHSTRRPGAHRPIARPLNPPSAAWVSWVQTCGDRRIHKIVCVHGGRLRPLETPDPELPRRVLGDDGQIRPLQPPA